MDVRFMRSIACRDTGHKTIRYESTQPSDDVGFQAIAVPAHRVFVVLYALLVAVTGQSLLQLLSFDGFLSCMIRSQDGIV